MVILNDGAIPWTPPGATPKSMSQAPSLAPTLMGSVCTNMATSGLDLCGTHIGMLA